MLKYVHVLLCATQYESVNAQSRVCGGRIFFASDQRSRWAGLGCCLLAVDKDVVCGTGLRAGAAAWIHEPDPWLHPRGVFSEIYL